ncbi:MAG: hypothetical protein IJJ74_03750 [Eubacterium sp.]|nr:hypothetical protein [Eubacterium sp.]MBR1675455.1 hypothetical protein [Eubacterium sp.]
MAVVVGIIGIIVALVGGILFGIIGGIAGVCLGILAIVLGCLKKKKGEGGSAGIVSGIAAIIMGVVLAFVFFGLANNIEERARKQGMTIVEEVAPSLKYGVIGFAREIDDKGYDMDEISDMINELDD